VKKVSACRDLFSHGVLRRKLGQSITVLVRNLTPFTRLTFRGGDANGRKLAGLNSAFPRRCGSAQDEAAEKTRKGPMHHRTPQITATVVGDCTTQNPALHVYDDSISYQLRFAVGRNAKSSGTLKLSAYRGRMTETALNVVSFLFLGFFLGMRHATDADHVVAIATIVSRERSLAGSALIGVAWGVGHTITVMAVGAAIILFGVVIPPQLGLSMEFAVGIMLVLLGVFTLTGMGRAVSAAHGHAGFPAGHALDLHDHLHAHGDYVHRHPHGHGPGAHGHAEEHTPLARLERSGLGRIAFYDWLRPFVVGLVHGLAGSAAVALMVLSIIREPFIALGYLLLFGLGTIVGMMLITLILSAPFAFTAVNLPKFNWRLRVASGLVSFVFGVILIYGIGFAEGGLFTDAPTWEPR